MTRPVRFPRAALALAAAALAAVPALAADDPPQAPVEVFEWSVWVGSPAQTTLNGPRTSRNAMPSAVGTSRPKLEDKDIANIPPVAPITVVQTFGDSSKDVDVDLRVKKGNLLAHWPPGRERSGRVQWFKSDLEPKPPAGSVQGYLPEGHWFQGLRKVEPALFVEYENRAERFLSYDAEVALPIPVKLRGGPEEYTLQNLNAAPLAHVAVIVPTDKGFRVGWLDELPAAAPDQLKDKAKEKEKEKAERDKKPAGEKAEEALAAAEKAADPKAKDDEPKPLPPEGDADIKARVDQILNRPITVAVEGAARKDVLDLVSGQARFRYELDDKTIAKEKINLGEPMSLKAPRIAARDALADVLGPVGLSYRVTEDGTLYVTTAARLAEAASKKGAVIEGPPVTLTLSQPLPATDPSYRELTRDSYARRLAELGVREEVIRTLLDQYGKAFFEPEGLIVLAHLSPEAIEDAVVLDVFPPPKKLVRVAAVVATGVDPRLQDRARELVKQLGDESPGNRESAESKLLGLGPVAVPALEDALRDKDVEIVFRAERILLKLNRPVP